MVRTHARIICSTVYTALLVPTLMSESDSLVSLLLLESSFPDIIKFYYFIYNDTFNAAKWP